MSHERFQRVSDLFTRAKKLGLHERDLFLVEACNGDDDLRRDVDRLLSAAGEPLPFAELADDLRGAREQIDAVPAAATMTDEQPELIHERGTRIGPYKLLEKIGEGGFGLVYVAEQREPVRRKVALKIIKLGMDTRQVIARFEAERQALAMMDHPNIAKVFDAGATDTGRPYFVMELVRGVPITEYCDTEKLDNRARLDLFTSVCHAIQHAHQKGVIHRDIKPSNVMVTLHDGVPVPKVIDFGIAKATSGELTDKTIYTLHRQMLGTPAYMSPEQAEMSGLDIDTRSDIYSLGVLLYELLTGTTPFDPERLRSAAYGEIQRIIREEEPHKPSARVSSLLSEPRTPVRGPYEPQAQAPGPSPPREKPIARAQGSSAFTQPVPRSPCPDPSSAIDIAKHRRTDPRSLAKQLRGDLDWIVMKCLEKDRTRRYETANGLGMDINRHLKNEPVLAGPPGAAYKFKKFTKRNKAAIATVGVVTAALLLGLTLAIYGFITASNERDQKVAALERARANFEKAREAVDHMLTEVSEKELAGLPQMEQVRRSLLEKALSFYEEFLAEQSDDPEVRVETGRSYGRAAEIQALLGLQNEAEQSYRKAIALIERSGDDPEVRRSLGVAWNNLGRLLSDAGRHDEAEQAYRTAIRLQETLINQRPNEHKYQQSLSVCWNSLGNLYKHTGRYEQAESAYEQALTLADALVREEPDNADYARRLAESSHNLGNLMRDTGRPAEAIPVYRQALAALDGRLESASSREQVPLRLILGDAWNSLGASLWDSRRLEEAEEAFRKAVPFAEKLVANFPRFPDYRDLLAMRLSNLGSVLHEQKRFDECEEPLRRSVEIRGKLVAEFPDLPMFRFGLAGAQMNIGVIYEDAKRFVEAEQSTRDAMERLSALAADFPEVPIYARTHANCLYNLGDIMMVTDRTAEAEPFFLQAIDIHSTLAGRYPDVPAYREQLFDTHRLLGNMHKALGRLERAEVEFDAALEAAATLPDGPRTQTPRFHHNLGHAWAALAYIYTDTARLDKALEAHGKALELRIPLAEEFPGDSHKQWDATVTSIHRAVLLMINMKRPADAEPDLRRAIGIAEVAVQKFPDNLDHLDHLASATSALGTVLFGQGRMSEAEEPTRRAQALLGELMEKRPDSRRYRPPYFGTYSALATILSRTGRLEEAAETFRNAVQRWPDEPGILNGHAWFLVTVEEPRLRDAQRAVELARRATALDPESGSYLGTLGVALYRNGNRTDAIETLTRGNVLKDGGDAYNFFVLAMAHEQLGDSDTARDWFDRGVTWMNENKPDNEDLQRLNAEAAVLLGLSEEANSNRGRATPP